MNDNLPPLPKPEALQRKQLNHGGYEMRPVFTPEQMREYGQLCRQQALEEWSDHMKRMADAICSKDKK